MSSGDERRLSRRDIWVSLLYGLGLWLALALVLGAVLPFLPSGGVGFDWPMILCAAVSALYIIVCWQYVPSLIWFVAGLALWTLVAFLLLAVAPVEWLELVFGVPEAA